MITETTFAIPLWLHDCCSIDLNSKHDWLNRPMYFSRSHGDNEWAVATDGVMCHAVKLPVTIFPTSDEYLCKPPQHVKDTLEDLLEFEREGHPAIDVPAFKSALTSKTKDCINCNNTRIADCMICGATTEITCNDCDGKGSFPCITCRKPDQCKTCDGLGVVECDSCENGKTNCQCLYSTKYPAEIKLKGESGFFDLFRLKQLLKRVNTNLYCKIKNNRITFWDKHQTMVLMGVLKQECPELNMDSYAKKS